MTNKSPVQLEMFDVKTLAPANISIQASFKQSNKNLANKIFKFLREMDIATRHNYLDSTYEIVDRPEGCKQHYNYQDDEDSEYIDLQTGKWRDFIQDNINKVPDHLKRINHVYVNQYTGIAGDDYYGHIYYPLELCSYLKIYYSM